MVLWCWAEERNPYSLHLSVKLFLLPPILVSHLQDGSSHRGAPLCLHPFTTFTHPPPSCLSGAGLQIPKAGEKHTVQTHPIPGSAHQLLPMHHCYIFSRAHQSANAASQGDPEAKQPDFCCPLSPPLQLHLLLVTPLPAPIDPGMNL